MLHRVQKIISMSGFCSRRKAEDLIRDGRVAVNGRVISIGTSADPDKDLIAIDRKRIFLQKKIYYAFYKPKGFLSSLTSFEGKKPISDFFPRGERLFPIGRLDLNTEGLMILTNDGDFANKVMHPRYEVEKEYRVSLDKPYTQEADAMIKGGLEVEGRKVDAVILKKDSKIVHIILHEGRKHIVKKLFALLDFRVTRLIRIKVGRVELGNLLPGRYRPLLKQEIYSFKGNPVCLKQSLEEE